jgi:hypothetical protein
MTKGAVRTDATLSESHDDVWPGKSEGRIEESDALISAAVLSPSQRRPAMKVCVFSRRTQSVRPAVPERGLGA